MKSFFAIFVFVLTSAHFCFPNSLSHQEELNRACKEGARTKVTFQVVDLDNKPVSNATVNVIFFLGSRIGERIQGLTDTNGLYTVESICIDYFDYGIEKEGYYLSVGEYVVISKDPERLRDGKWLPWNPIIQVNLKPMINPIGMKCQIEKKVIPRYDEPIGFDILENDWIEPFGKGKVNDMDITFSLNQKHRMESWMRVEFPGKMNGIYLGEKDEYSILKSPYHANTNHFYQSILENKERKWEGPFVLIGKDTYGVFRIRSQLNEQGELVNAYYGKIYGPFGFVINSIRYFSYRLFLNTNNNDTNIEFDGKGFGDGSLFGR